jgi:hypothetical protein
VVLFVFVQLCIYTAFTHIVKVAAFTHSKSCCCERNIYNPDLWILHDIFPLHVFMKCFSHISTVLTIIRSRLNSFTAEVKYLWCIKCAFSLIHIVYVMKKHISGGGGELAMSKCMSNIGIAQISEQRLNLSRS